MAKAGKKLNGGIGLFSQLSDDVVFFILSLTNSEFKNIIPLLLVSKSFASLIYRIIGKLTINVDANPTPGLCFSILHEILCSSRENTPSIIRQSSIKSLQFCTSLEKFKEVKSIHVKFNNPVIGPHTWYSPKRLKLICRCRESMVKSLVSILPASIRKKRGPDNVEEPVDLRNPVEFMETYLKIVKGPTARREPFSYLAEWLVLLFFLIKCHDSLESLTIGASNISNDDAFVLRGEQLVKWRNIMLSKKFPANDFVMQKVSLQLPLSGYVMKDAIVVVMRLQEESNDDDMPTEYDDVMTLQYKGEEQLLGEALTKLTSYADAQALIEK